MQSSHKHSHFSHVQTEKIHTLQHCVNVCEACSQMCIEEGHKKTAIICRDCADICSLYIKLESRHSQFAHRFQSLCRELFQKCAEECEKSNTEHCHECADICRAAQKACFME